MVSFSIPWSYGDYFGRYTIVSKGWLTNVLTALTTIVKSSQEYFRLILKTQIWAGKKDDGVTTGRRKEDEVFVAPDDAVDVLVGVLVRRRDGPAVAHPKIDGVRGFSESHPGPFELAGVLEQRLELLRQVGVLGKEENVRLVVDKHSSLLVQQFLKLWTLDDYVLAFDSTLPV